MGFGFEGYVKVRGVVGVFLFGLLFLGWRSLALLFWYGWFWLFGFLLTGKEVTFVDLFLEGLGPF